MADQNVLPADTDIANPPHQHLGNYLDARGCVFLRQTQRGFWRYRIGTTRAELDVPSPSAFLSAREWGNQREIVRRACDQAYSRAGESPFPNELPKPNGATASAPAPSPEPAPTAPPVEEPEPVEEEAAPTRSTRKGTKLTWQACPVAGCTQRAAGRHVLYHKNRGELPADFSFSLKAKARAARVASAPAPEPAPVVEPAAAPAPKRVRGAAVDRAPVVGPTSKSVRELLDTWAPEVDALRGYTKGLSQEVAAMVSTYTDRVAERIDRLETILHDVMKIASDQETALRITMQERDDANARWQGVAASVLSHADARGRVLGSQR